MADNYASWFGHVACGFGGSGSCSIYSIGDGTYMKHVLDGVAMLSNSNDLFMLGKIGFVLGLLVFAVKTVATGLQRMEMGYFLVSLILFVIMFGMKTDVVIYDMGGAPGVSPGGAYAVGNVPYGLAIVGSIVSQMGMQLAQDMEQAFGLPSGAGGGISDGGFGESLRWVNAVRNWELPEINDNNGDVGWYKANVSNYLADCFMWAVDNGQADVGKTFMAQNPWQMGNLNVGGLGVSNQFITTSYRDFIGVHTIPCNQAYQSLANVSGDPTLFANFATAIATRGMKMPGSVTNAANALDDAFNDIHLDSSKAQAYFAATALQAAWQDMLRHNGQSNPLDTLGDIMVSQADQQRATQWAASESMFRRVAQPMIAFFESMFYACAPFMALCIGFGAWGFQMVMRYLILSIWVMLWFPVLSIINLFQLTMVQHAVDAMQASGQLYDTSVAGVAYLQSNIVDWLATGAMLASATPAITLMLIFGGAVTASAIASKMSGDSHVDPKAVSPDVLKNQAAMDHAAMFTGTMGGGVVRSGTESMQPNIALSHAASVARSSTDRDRGIAAENFNAQWGEGVATTWAANHSGGVNAAHNLSMDASEGESRVANLLKGKGVNVKSGSEQAWSAVAAIAAKAGVDQALKFASGLGLMGGVSGQSQTENSQRANQAFQEMVDNKSSWAHDMQVATSQSIGDMAGQNASVSGGKSSSVSGNESFNKGLSDVKQKEAAYQDSASVEESARSSQSMRVMQMAQSIMNKDPALAAELGTYAHNLGGSTASENRAAIANADWRSASKEQNNIAADILTLSGNKFGGGNLPAAYAGDRAEALMGIAQKAGFVGASTTGMTVAGSNPDRNQGASAGVESGQAQSLVGQHPLGSPVSAAATKAEATSLQSGAPSTTQSALQGVISAAGAGKVNSADMATLNDPNGHGAAVIAGQAASNDEVPVGVGRKAQQDTAWNEEQAGTGKTAQFAGRVASMFAHPIDGVYKRGTGFVGAENRAFDTGDASAGASGVAKMNAAYDVIGMNPGQLVNASSVSSPEMARALTTVATFKQTGGITSGMAQQFESDMLHMSRPDQDAVMDYANSLTGIELLPSSVTAIVGGPVSGVSRVEPGKYR